MNADLREIYDRFATTYDANRSQFDISEIYEKFFSSLPVKQGVALDLGCGAGEPFARQFADRGWKVTGVDFSSKMLELAARYVPEMKTIHGDMREVEFGESTFDAIVAVYSLFHVPRAGHPRLFSRFARWLKPHGKVLFTYATKEYTGSERFEGTKDFLGETLFYSHETPEVLFEQLSAAGLAVDSADYHEVGGETFLWVTAVTRKTDSS